MSYNRIVKVIFLFILTYAILYFLGQFTDLHTWEFTNFAKADYMFFLIPITGFFFMYLLIDWVEKYYNTTLTNNIAFPIIFVVVALIAYYVVLYWYWQNLAQLAGRDEVVFDYVPLLLDSVYLVFILSALGGWVTRIVLDRLEKTS